MGQRTNNSAPLPIAAAALAAEPLFHIANIPVTNSMLNAWISVVIFLLVAFVASRRTSLVPKGIHNAFEAVVDLLLKEVEKVTESREKAKRFFPLVATIFFFVLLNNWLGLLPGTGSIGIWGVMHGETELIPLLRPATSDLNLTLAVAAFSVVATHVVGIRSIGVANHVSKFVNIRGIFRAIRKGPMAIAVAVIEFFVGLLEIVSEFAKTLSLSLRLFGNVFAGEILIGVMLSLVSYVMPIPFIFLEILVGVIQATVFAMLVLVFLTIMSTDHAHEEDGAHDKEHARAH